MLLEIQVGSDNPILRKKSVAVKKIDARVKKLVKNMMVTMLAKDGVGLAAPQVGMNERIVIINFGTTDKDRRPLALINPEIIEFSKTLALAEEGCLSLPGLFGKVKRAKEVTVKFFDESGRDRSLVLRDLNARATQHEVDHLDGILFIDHVHDQNGKMFRVKKTKRGTRFCGCANYPNCKWASWKKPQNLQG